MFYQEEIFQINTPSGAHISRFLAPGQLNVLVIITSFTQQTSASQQLKLIKTKNF